MLLRFGIQQHQLYQQCVQSLTQIRDSIMGWEEESTEPAGISELQHQLHDILKQVESTLCSASGIPSLDAELLPLPNILEETDAINSEKAVLAEELRHACCERVALENECVRTVHDTSEGEEPDISTEGTKEDYEVSSGELA